MAQITEEVKKIDEQQLKELQAAFKKVDVLAYLYQQEGKVLEGIKEAIREEYGDCEVNITTGVITYIPEDAEESEK